MGAGLFSHVGSARAAESSQLTNTSEVKGEKAPRGCATTYTFYGCIARASSTATTRTISCVLDMIFTYGNQDSNLILQHFPLACYPYTIAAVAGRGVEPRIVPRT